jgi:acetylornithine deacetylase/succinyl-diaminopimelate desuccinylase-like protein
MLLKPFRPLVLVVSLAVLTIATQAASPDFKAAHQELVELLRGFIRIDTSNPPGNETKACDYLKPFLEREGIPVEIS